MITPKILIQDRPVYIQHEIHKNSFSAYVFNEVYFSNIFYAHYVINRSVLESHEYWHLQKIWLNIAYINSIFFVIDDLIIQFKLPSDYRYLIIGDFLFSVLDFDAHDPTTFLLKFDRSIYMNKIRLRIHINYYFNIDNFKYLELHKKLLIGLRLNNVIIRETFRKIVKKKNIVTASTSVIYTLNVQTDFLFDKHILGITSLPFYLRIFGNSKYMLSGFRNVWKAKRRKKEMVDYPIAYNSIFKTSQIKYILSSNLLYLNTPYFDAEISNIFATLNCFTYSDYFLKIRNLIKDKSIYKSNIIDIYKNKDLYIESDEEDTYSDIIENYKKIDNTVTEYKKVVRFFQKIISIYKLQDIPFDKSIYIPSFMDNRGRQYYATLLSPTFNKIFRSLYEFSEKHELQNLEKSMYYNKLLEYMYLVQKYNKNNKESYYLLVIFQDLGKFFVKNTLNNTCNYSVEDLVLSGMEAYTTNNMNVAFEDKIYLTKIYKLCGNIIEGEPYDENTIIYKDATSSGLQNYGILLKYNPKMLKYLNLEGSIWCDTYQYIINRYLKNEDPKYLKRKYWKSTIMTIPYNSSWFTCFNKFKEALKNDGCIYSELDDITKNKLLNMHKKFYNDIKYDIKSLFYLNNFDLPYKFTYNDYILIKQDEYKINYKKHRDKYVDNLYMLKENVKKSKTAQEANNMHYLDALLVQYLVNILDLIPIHDCFGVRLCETHILMDSANNYYSKHIENKEYGLFILL